MRVPTKLVLLRNRLLRRWESEPLMLAAYREQHGRDADLADPRLFSEKLLWRMLMIERHGSLLMSRLTDKVLVRDHVSAKLGPEHLVKLLWHGPDPRLLPWDALPKPSMAKTNHGSGWNRAIRPGDRREEVVATFRRWLRNNCYWESRERQYDSIAPQMLVEEFLDEGRPDGPLGYKFWCFAGEPVVIQTSNTPHTLHSFYDPAWKRLPLTYRAKGGETELARPDTLPQMLRVAAELSREFEFVRVDLYSVRGRVLFGELTFTPVAGNFRLRPPGWDERLGAHWRLGRDLYGGAVRLPPGAQSGPGLDRGLSGPATLGSS